MKLDKPVQLRQEPFTDPKGNLQQPDPFTLEELQITYWDQPWTKQIGVQIMRVPTQVTLFAGEAYDALGDNRSLSLFQTKLKELMGENPQAYLQNLFPKTLESDPDGPGAILAGMISAMGIKSTPNCSCKRHALEMNNNGPDWCEENLGTILDWLNEEAQKRNLPFVRTVAKLMVQRAINKSRRLKKKKQNG
tara:strand:+ start:2614 stop:3189 length:576 start_codon:yes stop_codon:yes gene_type:complete